MTFHKYQHIERLGTDETEGILDGTCYIFPKLDGTNGCIWAEDGELHFGSRNRELLEEDNRGFIKYLGNKDNLGTLKLFFSNNPNLILYGEWLVPHSVRYYRDDAWNKFYVFDVCSITDGRLAYYTYEKYSTILNLYDIDYIPLIFADYNPTIQQLTETMNNNNYLMKREMMGEGIVIKNYDYINKYGRVTWAKMVRKEFAQKSKKPHRKLIDNDKIEENIVNEFLTLSMVEKIYNNVAEEIARYLIENRDKITKDPVLGAQPVWKPKSKSKLLQTAYYDLVREETWSFIKKYKDPIINFKKLRKACNERVKTLMPELF